MVRRRSENVRSPQSQVLKKIFFLYLCCKIFFILPPPCNDQRIFLTLKRSPSSYIKFRGTKSALYPLLTMEIWGSSITLNEFARDLHWCSRSKSGPEIWTAVAMATGSHLGSIRQKVCSVLKWGLLHLVFSHGMRMSAVFGVQVQVSISDTTNEPLEKLPPTALVLLPVKLV